VPTHLKSWELSEFEDYSIVDIDLKEWWERSFERG
jgi:hypothetical protein